MAGAGCVFDLVVCVCMCWTFQIEGVPVFYEESRAANNRVGVQSYDLPLHGE